MTTAKKQSVDLSIEQIDKLVSRATRVMKKKFPQSDAAELKQEGWVGVLTANNYNENKGDKKRYFYGAAINQMKNFITKGRSQVSGCYYEALDKFAGFEYLNLDSSFDVAEQAIQLGLLLEAERRKAIRNELTSLFADDTEQVIQFITKELSAICLAERRGVSVNNVYRQTKRWRRDIAASVALFKHWRDCTAGTVSCVTPVRRQTSEMQS